MRSHVQNYVVRQLVCGGALVAVALGVEAGVVVTSAGTSMVGAVRDIGQAVSVTVGATDVGLAKDALTWFSTDAAIVTPRIVKP